MTGVRLDRVSGGRGLVDHRLERRTGTLKENLAALDAELTGDGPRRPPRVTLLETEYLRTITAAEISWLDAIVRELRSGSLRWSGEELARTSLSFLSD